MKKIKVQLKKENDQSYDILIGSDLDFLKLLPFANRYILVTDSNVAKLYAKEILKILKKKSHADLLVIQAGEKSKNQTVKTQLESQMIKLGCGRDAMIIALGGGVVGDMAGFVASTFMRGITYVQIPTSLLAMVDSSVGGKTAIDTTLGKNLIGAFWQPKKVLIDLNFLNGLEPKHFLNGMIEALKMFLTFDKDMVKKFNEINIENIVSQAIKIKSGVVQRDEKENNERMILNFGHSVGHALESLSKYKLQHGQAVALGILVEAKISQLMNILPADSYDKIEKMITDLGTKPNQIKNYPVEKVLQTMKTDKKNSKGKYMMVLLKDIGVVYKKKGKYVCEVELSVIKKAFRYFNK